MNGNEKMKNVKTGMGVDVGMDMDVDGMLGLEGLGLGKEKEKEKGKGAEGGTDGGTKGGTRPKAPAGGAEGRCSGMVWNGVRGRWESPNADRVRKEMEEKRKIRTYETPKANGGVGERNYRTSVLNVVVDFDEGGEITGVALHEDHVRAEVLNMMRNVASGLDALSLILPKGGRAKVERFLDELVDECQYVTKGGKTVKWVRRGGK